MNNYDFVLTPGYCFFNGVGILNQQGSKIQFLIENSEDSLLKERLKRAFINHLEFVKRQESCPDYYKQPEEIIFTEGTRDELNKIISGLYSFREGEISGRNQENGDKKEENAAAVVLLDTLLRDAQQKGVTDIHIENLIVRFREQGNLKYQIRLQKEKFSELIQRIKLLAGMNLVENRRCQDGHFVAEINKKPLFVRVSSIPVVAGDYEEGNESVVLRLLDVNRLPLQLEKLGFDERQLNVLESLLKLKNGLILVCGPTGSGKSTTVCAMLAEMVKNSCGGMKIISLEDPPEYLISGITQIKVDYAHGNDFDEALNHIFRQDPDVLMIGEIRDKKSAMAALRGSLTGHLVFATVHSSSSALSLMRLENLGLNRKIVASVLKGVIVQELGYVGDEPLLMADVSTPVAGFDSKVKESLSESELDELFVHCVNSALTIRKTISLMKQKSVLKLESLEEPAETKAVNDESKNYELYPQAHMSKKNRKKLKMLPVIEGNPRSKRKTAGGKNYV